jgi:CheY-like chemotaxis protein/HPt (histidine-containing phosphotransfer) domain-containing protein
MAPGKPVVSENVNKAQIKILVVDDDDLNRRMMKVLLGREGYLVDLAANGIEALDAVKYQQYHLVFMDLQMPFMDGVETSRRIREWENGGIHTYIVALTASYLPEEGHVLYEAGIDNYISKPFEMEHIQRMLKYITDNHAETSSVEKKAVVKDDPTGGILDVQLGLRRVGGDEDTYKELLGGFMEELPAKLESFQPYFLQHDMSGLGRAAHNLRGVAANLGALKLSESAEKLDKRCNEGYTASIQGLIVEVQEMGSRLQEVARNFLAGANAMENIQQL